MASNASKLGSPAPEEKKNNNVIQEHYRLVLQWISNELSIKDENPRHWEKAPVKPVSFWLSPKAKKKKKKTCWKYCVFSTILSSKKMFWLVDKFKSVTSLNKLNKTHLTPILLIIQINYLLVYWMISQYRYWCWYWRKKQHNTGVVL